MTNRTTNTTPGTPAKPFNLDELSVILMRRDRVPYGFFVSQALWNALAARFMAESNTALGPMSQTFQSIPTAIDPSLLDTEFDVAFTPEAWTKRLRELRGSDGEEGKTK